MKNHQKILVGMVLFFTVLLVLPSTLTFTETEILGTTTVSHTRTIFQEDHRGRIVFSFDANDSLTVQITDASQVVVLWSTFGDNGSCDLNVDRSELYRAKFVKGTGYAVEVTYTVVEQGAIPGFELLYIGFVLLATIGLIYLKKHRSLMQA